jgi:shikimate kinase
MGMKDFIVIAGAPGSGKSTVAKAMQQKLKTPLFEFGWIPEFRYNGSSEISYTEDEALAFENLMLVVKNYAKHNFKNVIITDLENYHIEHLSEEFEGFTYSIFTLVLENKDALKARVLDKTRTSQYRNSEEAQLVNESLLKRRRLENETFIKADERTVEDIVREIIRSLSDAQ